ncbi:MAG: SYNERG-CTERM sorting domain-containing protein [Synergistaceae bacterium]|nr:SYNERG-CTERM sorting domain-containing protein [Synergistaceae bacterium]
MSEDIVLYSFSDGMTGIDMVVDVEGGSGEGANSGGSNASALSAGNAAAAAGEIEWIYPDIPGAEEVSVIYGDGTPVSSDFSLYRDKIFEQSEKASSGAGTSRSAAARPKLAPIRLNFAVDSNAFDDLELLGFNYKMKGSDEVYSVSMQGTGVNGGISFKDESKNGGQKDTAANSGGGGCNGGFAGLLALFAAALPLCAIKRGRS